MSHGLSLIQRGLESLGYDAGVPDGLWGPKTAAAMEACRANRGVPRQQARPVDDIPRQSAMALTYGEAGGPLCTAGRVRLPFAFPLAWDDDQRIAHFSCHARLEVRITAIFTEAARHFGEAEFRRLRLDRFGGCYNFRNIRGGSRLSTHAWGAAVDIDPVRNPLRMSAAEGAPLARPEYEPFWAIVESHGGVSLGRQKDYDWQHFQFATLD